MEDNYTTVVFRNKDVPSKVENEEQTLYSEVKIAPVEKEEQICTEMHEVKAPAKEEGSPVPEEQTLHSQTEKPSDEERTPEPRSESAPNFHDFQYFNVLAAFAATFSVILLVIVAVLIYFVVTMSSERVKLGGLSVENQRLIAEKRILENKTEEMIRQRDSLNWTLGVMMKFTTFPMEKFCPQKKCQPCQTGWIQFQEKCYYFYSESSWKTWNDSREYCKQENSDLIVTETVEEQEFVSENIKYYYSNFHGFWLGLRQDSDKNWLWVDGRNDTLGFWIQEPFGPVGSYALMIPGRPTNASWDKAEGEMWNKFICEQEILLKSF
ncbi:C-type lectin domain family 9 member A-like isoform X2 [Sphaeramia orbicularis]|uniref:C-type lectin domain family 9 member A-like isoform X2 n=1 Tax=Sphaeramia orbicularis TaxID=375764 RepID=UPI00117DCDCD|nr:C-type lectin domain family 9 member A-like isoform X2 [Sphaeramia orbicularis]